ncbi:hypothetical protein, partial [Parvibium lacunae]
LTGRAVNAGPAGLGLNPGRSNLGLGGAAWAEPALLSWREDTGGAAWPVSSSDPVDSIDNRALLNASNQASDSDYYGWGNRPALAPGMRPETLSLLSGLRPSGWGAGLGLLPQEPGAAPLLSEGFDPFNPDAGRLTSEGFDPFNPDAGRLTLAQNAYASKDPRFTMTDGGSNREVFLTRAQEERLQSGQTIFDSGDPYADPQGVTASSVGAQRRVSRSQQHEFSTESRGTAGIKNPDATDPFERFDLDTHEGRDKFFRQTKVNFAAGTLGSEQAMAAKAMLFHYYGYSMGENLGNTTAILEGSLQLTGPNDAALGRALNAYASSGPAAGRERYDFYSNIQVVYDENGIATRGRTVDVVREGRTVTLNWTQDFSTWAGHVGVSADEALRKTDFSVYKALQNAAFKTPDVISLDMNGAWRPAFADYRAIYDAQRQDPNANQANVAAMKAVIDGRPKGLDGQPKPWSPAHVNSRGIDINSINGVAVRNTIYNNGVPRNAEPAIISAFTDNLLNEPGTRQIFQPWRMWANVPKYLNLPSAEQIPEVNKGRSDNEKLHNNHIHYGR